MQSNNATTIHSQCRGCIYAGRTSFSPSCDYILMTGKRRPCPAPQGPKDKCSARTTQGQQRNRQKKKWDTRLADRLLAEGHSDEAVARMVGTTLKALRSWKQRWRIR